ncbi:MAG: apolipoprotein N-acyltransferase [Gemmatimonadaceae bacterium]
MRLRALVPTRAEALPVMASAALFAVAFPPFPLVVPIFLALVPLAVATARAADSAESVRSAARMGAWFCVLAYGCNLYWIASALSIYTNLAVLGYLGTLIGSAPIVAAAVSVLFFARRRLRLPVAVLLPPVWVASEMVFNYLGDLSFPWLPLGLAVSRVPVLAQSADLSGVHGVSLWIAAVNGLIADAVLLRRDRRAMLLRGAGAVTLVGLAAAYGAWRVRTVELRPLAPVAIIQPNVPQEEKWQEENRERIVGMLATLTRERLRAGDAELVLWPEAALPGFFTMHRAWADTLAALAQAGSTPILFGVLDVTFRSRDDYDYFNAAMLADSTGRVDVGDAYHKSYLVPVVERVPFVNPDWFEGLRYFGGYSPGAEAELITLPFGRLGVLICYESIFPQRSRRYRREGADLIVNITNDAWFGRSLAPHQHLAHLALRAIENRVGIVRSANTGISGYIDPLGRMHGTTGLFVTTTETYQAETTSVRTPYVRLGDWVGWGSVAAVLLVLIIGHRRRGAP